jgi:hypothetical protein
MAIDPEDDQWEVERLLDDIRVRGTYRRNNRSKHFYLVKWMGFDYDECSWQEAEDIDKELIREYENAVAKGDITRGVWGSKIPFKLGSAVSGHPTSLFGLICCQFSSLRPRV